MLSDSEKKAIEAEEYRKQVRRDLGNSGGGLASTAVFFSYIGALLLPLVGILAGIAYLLKRSPDTYTAESETRHGFILILISLLNAAIGVVIFLEWK